jgi:membrane protein DedA with SNARE-associated domain
LLSSLWSNRLRLLGVAAIVAGSLAFIWTVRHFMPGADEAKRLIHQYGVWFYFLTFAWTFFEGETFVLFAGYFAAQGLLSAPLLLVAAGLGSFAGDQCYFWIGRYYGPWLLSRRPFWRGSVDSALRWVKRYDKWFVLSFRFTYGIRNVSSFALGISGIAWQRFFYLNFIAAFLWATTFVGAGYFCGRAMERMLGKIAEGVGLILLCGFAVGGTALYVVHRWRRRRRRERDAAAEAISSSSEPA